MYQYISRRKYVLFDGTGIQARSISARFSSMYKRYDQFTSQITWFNQMKKTSVKCLNLNHFIIRAVLSGIVNVFIKTIYELYKQNHWIGLSSEKQIVFKKCFFQIIVSELFNEILGTIFVAMIS